MNILKEAAEVGAGLYESYPALTSFLTGYGGRVASAHFLGVASKGLGAHVAVSAVGAYAGLRVAALIPALRDYLGVCNP